jgi:hypothetical protein
MNEGAKHWSFECSEAWETNKRPLKPFKQPQSNWSAREGSAIFLKGSSIFFQVPQRSVNSKNTYKSSTILFHPRNFQEDYSKVDLLTQFPSHFSIPLQWPKRTHTNTHQQQPAHGTSTSTLKTPIEFNDSSQNATSATLQNATAATNSTVHSVVDASSLKSSNELGAKDFHSENGDIKFNSRHSDIKVDLDNRISENVVAEETTIAAPEIHHKVKQKSPSKKKSKYQDFDASLVPDDGILSSIMKVLGLNQCPAMPPDLNGPIEVDTQTESMESVEKRLADKITMGGRFKPSDCRARDRVAIVVPFRDRKQHLPILLKNLHPFLMKQQIDYGIFLVEQSADGSFNRAKLMNVGFVEALKLYEWDCFVFHDVDLLPMDDRNLYTCPDQPRHMSVAVDTFGFK